MNEIWLYILKANLVIMLCYLFYWCLLRNEKFFSLNRFFLLGTIVFTFLLPLLPGTMLPGIKEKIVPPLHQPFSTIDWLPAYTESRVPMPAGEQTAAKTTTGWQNTSSRFDLSQIAAILYGLISLSLVTRFVWQLFQLSGMLKGNETKEIDGIIYHRTDKPLPSFSFFQHIVINKSQSEKDLEQIIAHEKVHIRQWHIVDILLANLVQIAFWINPFVWMLNRAIRLNLEYIADEEVLKTGVDCKAYQVNILTSCLNTAEFELANFFHSSKIKRRIKMINTNKSPLSHLYKYTFMLPLLLASYFLMNPANAQLTRQDETAAKDKASASVISQKTPEASQQQTAQADLLIEAIDEGNESSFNSLLKEGLNVNIAGSEGWTPLNFSITENKPRFTNLLLEKGADINYNADREPTPLLLAVLKGDFDLVKLLVGKGADVNKAVSGDGSPLIAAAKQGNAQMVFFLVEKGADVNLPVPGDGNPLIAAAANGNAQIVTFLVDKGAQVNAIVPGDETALINAAGQGHLDVAKYLVSKGADVNLAVMANEDLNPELRSPLNQAIKHGHKEVASYLREKGAKE